MPKSTKNLQKTLNAQLQKALNHSPPNPDAQLDAHYEAVIKPFLKRVIQYCREYRAKYGEIPYGDCCSNCKPLLWPNPDFEDAAGHILDILDMEHFC